MSKFTSVATVAAAFAGVLSAQGTAVFPGDHTNPAGSPAYVNGYAYTGQYPLSNGISRTMYVYETWDLAVPDGARITHVGFPRDENNASFGKAIRLEILMGASTRTAATADREFDKNYKSGSGTVVYGLKTLTLPDLGTVTTGPRNDEVRIQLDTPFVLDKRDNLAIEYRVHANANGNQAFSYLLDRGRFMSPVTSFGQPCQTSSGKLPKLTSSRTAIGQNWGVALTSAPASATVYLLIGTPVAPIPLPGAPGCNVVVSPVVALLDMTNTAGSKSWSFAVPNNLGLYKASLYSQVVAVDFFANGLGAVVSNGDQVQLGVDPSQTMISATGNPTATMGILSRNWGQLALFDWQP